ncbi:MAG: 2-hydroxyacyl-CoA dehydratase subunit D [Syntrophobacteraceae bacterium]
MVVMDGLVRYLDDRLSELSAIRGRGRKVIGYTPGGYLPDELVLACGAVPLGMIRGGDHAAVENAGAYLCRWIDPFCRAQIGYGVSGNDLYYSSVDLLVVPITDNHIRGISDVLSFRTDLEVYPFGVPHKKDASAFEYYYAKLQRLKKKLEDFTGTKITDQRLREAINLCNRERRLFREISLKRKAEPLIISGSDFIALNHASFILDKEIMVGILEKVNQDMNECTGNGGGPRILLTGSTLAQGDSKVPDLIVEAGGRIVIEEFAEGIRPYWYDVSLDEDPLQALADAYFRRRIPPAWFRPGRERLNFLVHLAKDYRVDGVIWYQLMFRESYKIESCFFPDILREQTGLTMLIVESDYDDGETEPMRTRIETYIESIRS